MVRSGFPRRPCLDNLILILHVAVCVVLIVAVLLQSGKEGMGVIFGGGSSSLFGSTGAGGILVKLTTFLGIIFVVTCLSYNVVTSTVSRSDSLILSEPVDDPSLAPVAPASTESAPEAPAETSEAPAPEATTEAPVSEATPETPAPEATPEAPASEAVPETPAAEVPAEATPAAQ